MERNMTYKELAVLNVKLDKLQDHLIEQDNLIKKTLELVEEYLISVGEMITKLEADNVS